HQIPELRCADQISLRPPRPRGRELDENGSKDDEGKHGSSVLIGITSTRDKGEGRREKGEGRRQKAEGRRTGPGSSFAFLTFALSLLPCPSPLSFLPSPIARAGALRRGDVGRAASRCARERAVRGPDRPTARP